MGYNAPRENQEKDGGLDVVQEGGDVVKQTPTWLTNTSFKDFQETVNKTQPIEVLSSSSDIGDDHVIEIPSDGSNSGPERKKKASKRKKKRRTKRSSSIGSDSSDDFIERARRRRHARSSSSSSLSSSRSRSREKSREKERKRSRSRR